MSKTIDKKVVEMQFDNSNFESNVRTSMSTLDKLKEKLNFSGTAKAFEELDRAAASTTFSGLTSGLETVSSKFSALDAIAFTTLQHITESAISTGEQLIKSLSIDQITAGWTKFDQKNTGVATIMNATGKSVDEVNESLAKLNWFTDETSYNFTDMINNIGKFTSNGIELEKAVTAMEGISTAAALAGQNATAAGRVMYNFSQSLGMGAVKLQDWMSVENANMATKEFKETIIATAKELGRLDAAGTILDPAEKYGGPDQVTFENFRNTLSAAWFDADVLIGALKKYGDFTDQLNSATEEVGITTTEMLGYLSEFTDGTLDMATLSDETGVSAARLGQIFENLGSDTYDLGRRAFKAAQEAKTFQEAIDATKDAVSTGWMNTFEIIFGNYEEAKELWTELAEVLWEAFASGAEARNALLEDWKKLGGRDDLIEAFRNVATALETVITPIREGFAEIFPPITYEKLKDLTQGIENFTARLIISKDSAEKLNRTVQGIAAAVDIVVFTIQTGAKTAFEFLQELIGDTNFNLLNFSFNIAGNIVAFRDWIRESGKLEEAFKGIKNVVEEIVKPIKDAFVAIFPEDLSRAITDKAHEIKDRAKEIVSSIADITNNFKLSEETSDKLERTFKGIFAIFDIFKDLVVGVLKTSFELIEEIIGSNSDETENFGQRILSLTAGIGDAIVAFRDWLEEGDRLTGVLSKIKDVAVDVIGFVIKLADAIGAFLFGITEDISIPGFEKFSSVLTVIGNAAKSVIDFVGSLIEKVKEFPFVQETLGKIGDFLGVPEEGFGSFGDVVDFVTEKVGNLISAIGDLDLIKIDNVSGEFEGFHISVSDILNSIREKIDALKQKVGNFVGGIPNLFGIIVGLFQYMKQNVSDHLQAIGDKFDWLKDKIEIFKNKIAGFFEFLGIDFESLKERFASEGGVLGALLTVGTGIGMIAFITKIGKLINALSSPLELIEKLSKSIGKYLKAAGFEKKAQGIKEIGEGVAFLAGSLIVLALVPYERLSQAMKIMWQFVGILATLSAVMEGLNIASSKFGSAEGNPITRFVNGFKGVNVLAVSLSFVALASAVDKLIDIIGKLGSIEFDFSESYDELLTLAGLLAALTIAMKIMGSGANAVKATAILAVPLAMYLVVKLLDKIDKEFEIDNIGGLVIKLIAIVGTIWLLAAALNQGTKYGNALKTGLGMLAVTASLLVIEKALDKLAEFVKGNSDDVILKAAGIVTGALILLRIVATGMGEGNQYSVKAGLGVIAISAAVLVLAEALKIIAEIAKTDSVALWQAVAVIVILETFLGGLIAATALAKGSKGMVILLGVILGELVIALGVLSFLGPETQANIKNVAGCMALLMVAFAVMELGAGFLDGAYGEILLLGLIVAELAAILGLMTYWNLEPSIETAESLALLLGTLGAVMVALGTKWAQNVTAKEVGIVALLGLVVGEIGLILEGLAALENIGGGMQPSIETTGQIARLLGAMAIVMNALGTGLAANVNAGTIGILALLGLVVAEVGVIVEALAFAEKEWGLQPSITTAGAVAILLGAMAGVCDAVIPAGMVADKALAGVTVLVAFAAELITLFGGLAALAGYLEGEENSFSNLLDKGIPILIQIAEGMGEFIGAFVGGIGEGFVATLPQIGNSLSEFADTLKPFTETMSQIKEDAVSGVESVVKMVATLGSANFKDAITSFFSGGRDLGEFTSVLPNVGTHIGRFGELVKNISLDAVNTAVNALLDLAPLMGDIPKVDTKNLESFKSGLLTFGEAMKVYGKKVEKLPIDVIDMSATAAGKLVDVAKNIPEKGSFKSLLFGKPQDIDDFGESLITFARCLKDYSTAIGGIDSAGIANIELSLIVAQGMVDLCNTLPQERSIFQLFGKNNPEEIQDFGKKMVKFAESLVEYSTVAGEITIIDNAAILSVAEDISGFAATITKEQVDNLKNFGDAMVKFGKKVAEYSEKLEEVNTAHLHNVIEESKELAEAFPQINAGEEKEGGILSGLFGSLTNGGSNLLGSVTQILGSLKTEAANATAKLKENADADTTEIQNIVSRTGDDIVLDVAETGSEVDTEFGGILQSMLDNLGLKTVDVESAFGNFMGSGISKIEEYLPDYITSGDDIMASMTSGFEFGEVDFLNANSSAMQDALAEIWNYTDDYSSSGTALFESFLGGFENGIPNMEVIASNVANSGAKAMDSQIYNFETGGFNAVQGFVNGMANSSYLAEQAGAALGNKFMSGLNASLDEHSPSRVTYKSGEFAVLGFVNALSDYGTRVFSAGELLGQSAANGLTDTVSTIASLLEDNVETEPVIRPILDLTEIQNGSKKIGQLTSGVGTYTLNRSIENAEGAAYYAGYRQNVAVEENGSGDPVPVGVGSTYNNVFNISGESPKEIANEVSRILRHQVERKDASWA